MGWNKLLHGDPKQRLSAKDKATQKTKRKTLLIGGAVGLGVLILGIVLYAVLKKPNLQKTTDDPSLLKLQRLMELYQRYASEKGGKPPPNEQAFKDFLQRLPKEDRDTQGVGDDVDGFLVSPRDGQKYAIKYGTMPDPSQASQAFAWEQTGKDGKRFVYLSMGYVVEDNEQSFNSRKR